MSILHCAKNATLAAAGFFVFFGFSFLGSSAKASDRMSATCAFHLTAPTEAVELAGHLIELGTIDDASRAEAALDAIEQEFRSKHPEKPWPYREFLRASWSSMQTKNFRDDERVREDLVAFYAALLEHYAQSERKRAPAFRTRVGTMAAAAFGGVASLGFVLTAVLEHLRASAQFTDALHGVYASTLLTTAFWLISEHSQQQLDQIHSSLDELKHKLKNLLVVLNAGELRAVRQMLVEWNALLRSAPHARFFHELADAITQRQLVIERLDEY